ncbi:sulfotransferase 1C4-like [Ptychodera flava]|uniref:sulfotransferase 1C4-like n=1 Tax=Ptychodera flava TaxID=63121 RepID=UPI00396A0AE6
MDDSKQENPRLLRFPYGKVKTMEVRHDDIFLSTYPKSGTHWVLRIIASILGGTDIDATGRRASEAPFVEMMLTEEGDDPRLLMAKRNHGHPVNFNPSMMKSPRLMTTHATYDLLPTQFHEKRPKLIYVARNPKDLSVSAFKQFSVPPFHVHDEFPQFLEEFLAGKAIANIGHWGSHVLDWWKRRHDNNVLYLKYEDIRKDLKAAIQKIAEFIGKDLTPEDINKIAHHCSFDYMKKAFQDDAFMKAMGFKENPFVRRGKVGGWKETLTVAQNEMMDKYCEEWLKGTGLEFEME